MRAFRLLSLAAIAMAVLAACATGRGVVVKAGPTKQLDAAKISHLISTGKPLDALADISSLQGRQSVAIPEKTLAALREAAEAKTAVLFDQAVKSQNFGNALALYTSAQAYGGGARFKNWSAGRLLYAIATDDLKKGIDVPALLAFRKALAGGAKPGKTLDTFGKLALSENDRTTIKEIVSYLSSHHLKVPPAYSKLLATHPNPATLVTGVVTVWVNLGIGYHNGVGVPQGDIGTAFFIDKNGYLITNFHVIRGVVSGPDKDFARLSIVPYNKQKLHIPARVVGYDKVLDIALLKAKVKPQHIFAFGSSESVQPGEKIVAIGSPGGLQNTVTSGIVSATDRHFLQIGNTLQVDVPINPGNSGGPLLDRRSQVIGVNFAGIPQFQGVNFSIPIHWVEKILPQLYAGGAVKTPWLGIDVQAAAKGLEVAYVLPGSPAGEAGINQGSVIESIDGKRYSTVTSAQNALLNERPGMLVRVAWKADGREHSALITLGVRPFIPLRVALRRDTRAHILAPLFGMEVKETGHFLWQSSYRITKVFAGSVADQTGLSAGDPISILGWQVDRKQNLVVLQFHVAKRGFGFGTGNVQVGASLQTHDFL